MTRASLQGLGWIVGPILLVGLPSHQAALQAQELEAPSVVRGQVMEYETGRPLAGAAVSLASGPGGTQGIGTRVTGSDGTFLFRQCPPWELPAPGDPHWVQGD